MDLYELVSKLKDIEKVTEQEMAPAVVPESKPTMSVNMSAQGDSIKDLLKILSTIDSEPATIDSPEMEAYANEPDPEEEDIDYMLNTLAGGMNKPKKTHSKVGGGDNPLQKVSTGESLQDILRTELQQKLREYKGK